MSETATLLDGTTVVAETLHEAIIGADIASRYPRLAGSEVKVTFVPTRYKNEPARGRGRSRRSFGKPLPTRTEEALRICSEGYRALMQERPAPFPQPL